ncbi:ATP-binding protein [Streptomyces niveus]|uniref:ATP-binding protein n=1 Tax=Streptomyces niveus TaxID=193462 RepID=UPI0036764332
MHRHLYTPLDLPANPLSVGVAREHVRETLANWSLPQPCVAAAVQIVSELVTNGVQHGVAQGTVSLDLDLNGGILTVTVTNEVERDQKALTVRADTIDDDAEGGRGLLLVAAYAHNWDHDRPRPDRVSVWATIKQAEEPTR